MKILFIGGTGIISSSCSREVVRQGHELFLLNRGNHPERLPDGAVIYRGDARDPEQTRRFLSGHHFDCIVNWIAFEPEHIQQDVELLGPLTSHYIFISSASVYIKPPRDWIITERTPVGNPFWPYASKKIACEELVLAAHLRDGFPATVVRPTHTYSDGWIPSPLGSRDFTVAKRILDGREVISPGDGQSVWTLTHSDDFAAGLIGLLGKEDAKGEVFHITSDEAATWDSIYGTIGQALGVKPQIVHIPSEVVLRISPLLGQGLMGDKAYSMVFDNSKIKRLVPSFKAKVTLADGLRRSLKWFDEDPARKVVDPVRDAEIDKALKVWKEKFADN